jgi:hypothetical protein
LLAQASVLQLLEDLMSAEVAKRVAAEAAFSEIKKKEPVRA